MFCCENISSNCTKCCQTPTHAGPNRTNVNYNLESLLKVYASIKSIPNYSVEDYVRFEKKKTDFEEHHFVMFYMICNVICFESENCFLL